MDGITVGGDGALEGDRALEKIVRPRAGQARKGRRPRRAHAMAGMAHGGFSSARRYIAMDRLDTAKIGVAGRRSRGAGNRHEGRREYEGRRGSGNHDRGPRHPGTAARFLWHRLPYNLTLMN